MTALDRVLGEIESWASRNNATRVTKLVAVVRAAGARREALRLMDESGPPDSDHLRSLYEKALRDEHTALAALTAGHDKDAAP